MGVEAQLQVGERAQFDVVVDGDLVASRSRNLLVRWLGIGWPDEQEIVEAVRSRLSAGEGPLRNR